MAPKWANIKRYLNAKETEVIELTSINENKNRNQYSWRFVFAYNQYGYDWSFATNLKMNSNNIVKLYKCR